MNDFIRMENIACSPRNMITSTINDNSMMINLTISWYNRWFSKYLGGRITSVSAPAGQSKPPAIKAIYKHAQTGQVRIYTHDKGWPVDGATIAINGLPAHSIRRAGRLGRLHIVT